MSSTARLRLRRDTASGWTTANPVLLLGEVGIETDTRNFKVGNGSSGWTALQYYITSSLPLVRGQVSKMDAGAITIATQGAYVSTGVTGTFDAATAEGTALGTADAFAVKNTSGATKLMQVYGSVDAKDGNNLTLGVKLALNGVPIDETECRAFTGSGGQEAKLVTNWMIEMDDDDEVALFVANHTSTSNLEFRRGRLVAVEVR